MNKTIKTDTLKALSQFISSDQSRPALTGIGIKDGTAAACDGFILGHAAVETNGYAGIIDAKHALNIAKAVKECDTIELITDIDEPRITAMTSDARAVPSANYGPLLTIETTTDYPDWRQIVPPERDTDRVIHLAPGLLDKLVRAAKAVGAETIELRIQEEPIAKPVAFHLHQSTGYQSSEKVMSGVVMPMVPPKKKD